MYCDVIRICLRYGNLDLLEDGYGINLLPLAAFAMEIYGEDPCVCFAVKGREGKNRFLLSVREKNAQSDYDNSV